MPFLDPFRRLGGNYRDFYRAFIAFVENGVRETAVKVHFGAQNCSENVAFYQQCYNIPAKVPNVFTSWGFLGFLGILGAFVGYLRLSEPSFWLETMESSLSGQIF